MRESTFLRSLTAITVILLAFGCAKIGSPSGGPKDKDAPVVLKTVPANGTLNFRGNEISIFFNEYVILDKINEKFMVSPPLSKRPQISTRGKSVRVVFDEKLRDSSTYTFYFQDAIRDLNENNPINNYQFVLSTGPYIDSLSVTGNVSTAYTLNPPENTLVMLYRNLADSFVVKHLPDYITRVERNGEFRINNVHQGTYRLYALTDADNSKTYNNRDEGFAFYPETVSITPAMNFLPEKKDTIKVNPVNGKIPLKPPVEGEYQLILFQAEKKAHYLTSSARKLAYQLIYTLSLPPDSMKFSFTIPGAARKSWFLQQSKNLDTTIVWITDSALYNRLQILSIVEYPFTDSLGVTHMKTDSINMRYIAPRASRMKIAKRTPYKVSNGIPTAQVRPDKHIVFTAPVPFAESDTSRIRLFEIIKDKKERVPYSLGRDTANRCRMKMDTELKSGKSYLLVADSAAFRSLWGDISDSTGTRFTVMTPEMFGTLTLDIKNYEGGRIIQLLDPSEKVLRETYMKSDGKITFPLLEKGKYRLRVIYDLNGDGKWTTGDFTLHRQPEPVSFYPSELEIKENWEIVQTWDLKQENFKDFKLIDTSKRDQTPRTK